MKKVLQGAHIFEALFQEFWLMNTATTPQGVLLVKSIEPPYAERHVRWCGRSGKYLHFPSYPIVLID